MAAVTARVNITGLPSYFFDNPGGLVAPAGYELLRLWMVLLPSSGSSLNPVSVQVKLPLCNLSPPEHQVLCSAAIAL